jgi:hypothetical protein
LAYDADEFYHVFSFKLAEIDCEGKLDPKYCTEVSVLAILMELGYEPTEVATQAAFKAVRDLIQEDGTFSIDEVADAATEKLYAVRA